MDTGVYVRTIHAGYDNRLSARILDLHSDDIGDGLIGYGIKRTKNVIARHLQGREVPNTNYMASSIVYGDEIVVIDQRPDV